MPLAPVGLSGKVKRVTVDPLSVELPVTFEAQILKEYWVPCPRGVIAFDVVVAVVVDPELHVEGAVAPD